jgi:hypothetical protein
MNLSVSLSTHARRCSWPEPTRGQLLFPKSGIIRQWRKTQLQLTVHFEGVADAANNSISIEINSGESDEKIHCSFSHGRACHNGLRL